MKLHWPWHRKHESEGGGDVAREAKERAERALAEQRRLWPEVREARLTLEQLAERAMRGHR